MLFERLIVWLRSTARSNIRLKYCEGYLESFLELKPLFGHFVVRPGKRFNTKPAPCQEEYSGRNKEKKVVTDNKVAGPLRREKRRQTWLPEQDSKRPLRWAAGRVSRP
ncbi:MAG: hypothetical protein QOJ64_2754 [Acidobacteriota bacterium]|nr:hypothetical protein [Acidobacteriota bacterium]